jgi:hypothetical protein
MLTSTDNTSVSVQPQFVQSPGSVLVDGASGMLILTCIIGLVKMASPVILGTFRAKQDAQIQAQKESRQSELDIEAATAATMRSLLEQNTKASIAMNHETLEVLSGHLASTLEAVVAKLSELGVQMDKVSETQQMISTTQGQIASTQVRTLELLSSIEENIRQDKPVRRLDRDRRRN